MIASFTGKKILLDLDFQVNLQVEIFWSLPRNPPGFPGGFLGRFFSGNPPRPFQ